MLIYPSVKTARCTNLTLPIRQNGIFLLIDLCFSRAAPLCPFATVKKTVYQRP
jgi:hypothetical protein